jgi:hypothetical protein
MGVLGKKDGVVAVAVKAYLDDDGGARGDDTCTSVYDVSSSIPLNIVSESPPGAFLYEED